MKAVVRHEYGSPDTLKLEDIPKPVPGDGDVLVKVHAASVNAADLDYLKGVPRVGRLGLGLFKPKNTVMGLDVAGEVEATGRDVTQLEPGDEVFGDLTDFGFGAFAEYACAPAKAFSLKPAGLTFEQAATVPQSAVLALQSLRAGGDIRTGQRVLINGAGGCVGPFAVQIAKSLGAEVTGVDSARKLDMLRSIGADHVIDYAREDFTSKGESYDLILDMASYHPISDCRRALNRTGVYVIAGGPLEKFFQVMCLWPLTAMTGNRRTRVVLWKAFLAEDVARIRELLEAGDVVPVIDRSYGLSEVPDALRYQEQGLPRGKVVISV